MKAVNQLDESKLAKFIRSAKYRLHFIAPGVMPETAKALAEQWKKLRTDMQVILDVDPEVCRLGYGTIDALKMLQDTAEELGNDCMVCREPGVRIGIVVADGRVMVYSPIPLMVATGNEQTDKINCMVIDELPPELADDVGIGPNKVADQSIGLDKATSADVAEVDKDLETNPPRNFDLARIVRVFNARLEFVEFELRGCEIKRKQFRLPRDLQPLARANKRNRGRIGDGGEIYI